ncbi:Scr1 family TA system antitoxin-like transcriptional regulator [Saccharopolyspora sp. CA-218241]|uniref:Scr1 family TA system antitoxin-like transcriptional regulator n=1 Tax=Saccharopolyspora sp. CA-218241 TaxID=3240027 RepID=UPI003D96E6E7
MRLRPDTARSLRHLTTLAEADNVVIRVIPMGLQRWTLAHEGTFALYSFAKAAPIVQLEHFQGPAFVHDKKDLDLYRKAVDTLQSEAMSNVESTALLATTVEQLEGGRP